MCTEYKQCHKCGQIVLLADGDEVMGTSFWACNRCLDKMDQDVGKEPEVIKEVKSCRL